MRPHKSRFSQSDWEAIVVAVVLMLSGLVLLGGDYLGVLSLDRIQNLWPLAVITVGLADLVSVGRSTGSQARPAASQE